MKAKVKEKRSTRRSLALFRRAKQFIPGGVNSPVRAYSAVGGNPPFIIKGKGAYIFDVDGNRYIDLVMSWGPLILGHAHPHVVKAIANTAKLGTSFGAPTENEIKLAELVCKAYPSIEKLRLVNSGTEATMSALRLARAFTGRDIIIKFEGCYHGHSDGLLVKAGSGAATFGVPSSPGVPAEFARLTLTAPYNDLDAVRKIAKEKGDKIAGIIVEPIAGNMGVVIPQKGFLEGLREICNRIGALLIFDEVISGFRVDFGGAQKLYRVTPDITCLGKILGGGLPVGAYGGRKDIMSKIAPEGPVYQAGTLSGNPVAVSAGLATLELLENAGVYKLLEQKGAILEKGIKESAQKAGIPVSINRVGSMLTVFFTEGPVTNFKEASQQNLKAFNIFFHALLERKVYSAPSAFEAAFISTAHSEKNLKEVIKAVEDAMELIKFI